MLNIGGSIQVLGYLSVILVVGWFLRWIYTRGKDAEKLDRFKMGLDHLEEYRDEADEIDVRTKKKLKEVSDSKHNALAFWLRKRK